MKKRIAMFLCLILLVVASTNSNKEVRAYEACKAEATEPKTQSTITQERIKPVRDENGLITAGYLKNLSWKEIKNNREELFKSEEDLHLSDIVRYIDRKEEFDTKTSYLSSVNRMVYLKSTDYETMCEKLQIIAEAYNKANEIQIKAYTRLYDDKEGKMEIVILSSNYPASFVGEEVEVKWGAIFYETSEDWGNGNWNTTFCIDYEGYGFGTPEFIPEDYIVLINGVSYLDENGKITSSYYKSYDEIKENDIKLPIDKDKPYMLHICTSERDLGWGVPEIVKSVN